MIRVSSLILILICLALSLLVSAHKGGEQALSKIAIHRITLADQASVSLKASPPVLGVKGETSEWVTLDYTNANPSNEDWIGVFSPANFSGSICKTENQREYPPFLCTAPIKYQYANKSDGNYVITGRGRLMFRLINQREDFAFALFSGGLHDPKLLGTSSRISFANPKAPVYPRLSQGKEWNEMVVTWTSGYNIDEAIPLVEWGLKGGITTQSPAGTLTFTRSSMCGPPARTVGWRDPGFIHSSFLKNLWPNQVYEYKLGHRLGDGSYIWSQTYRFKAFPFPGQESLQQVIIFGDMGKGEEDGSNEYNAFQFGSLNTTRQLVRDLENIDMVFHIGDIVYANGYLSQWDQFTEQIVPIASSVPYMIASGNHERDWPGSGSFYATTDSGGECGVLAQTMFYVPADNRAKPWYVADYGMFRFCVADTEQDWRRGSEQYEFLERCMASVDREKQPWLVFLAHRVLGYSSASFYVEEGSFEEPMGRESLQELWQRYRVDLAVYGHVHNYERSCPIYQNMCTSKERTHYEGALNGTIHIVAGGGGASLADFAAVETSWSLVRDYDFGFVKLTALDRSTLRVHYLKSRDGEVHDSFTISRHYRNILACIHDGCSSTTLAS
ncbi:putative inactive purple acid phosphatase 1 [Wolffia australiana]